MAARAGSDPRFRGAPRKNLEPVPVDYFNEDGYGAIFPPKSHAGWHRGRLYARD